MKLLALCFVLAGSAAVAAGEVPPPATGVTVKEVAGARIIEAVLPGRALDTIHVTGQGVTILLTPENQPDGPPALYRFDPAGDGTLSPRLDDLPPEVEAIDVLEGANGATLIAGEPGRIYSLGPLDAPARPRLLLEAPDLDLPRLRRRRLITAERAFVPRPRLSRLDVYRWHDQDAQPTTLELPVRARRVRTGLVLKSPRVRLLERQDEAPRVAIGPEQQGKRRLLTTLIDPLADDRETADDREAWAQLSANEKVAQSWYLNVDGRPMLAIAALSADKLGIFEKKKLRVFPLRTDRTRAGSPPALAIDTATRNWYHLGVHVADLDLDGRDDLVVVQPDGLGAKKLVVEAFRGKGTGGFFLTPRRSVVVAQDADWAYGQDLDGDRIADLVAACGGKVLIFRGTARKKLVIEKTPRWSFDTADLGDAPDPEVEIHVGDEEGGNDEDSDEEDSDGDSDSERTLEPPRVADLDGDGRSEILLQGEIGGRTVLRVILLR